MAKLKAAPGLGAAPSALGYAPGDERERNRRRLNREPYRAWYQSAQWKRIRQQVFARDNYICQRTGTLCCGKGNEWNAPVANHKRPHRGNRALFFDVENVETVTKQVHDSIIQAEEATARARGEA